MRHTGRSEIPLTDAGREEAKLLSAALAGWSFERVYTSPLSRARETCELAGFADGARTTDALLEWDYGEYEGITTKEIRASRPGWFLWRDGCPGGETADQVGARVDPLIAELKAGEGDAALFAHGHLLRVARPPAAGRGAVRARDGHALRARLRARDGSDQALECAGGRSRRRAQREPGRAFMTAPASATIGTKSPTMPNMFLPL